MPTSTLSGEAEWPQVAGAVIEAGQVAETQPAKVVRRAHETIKLEFKPC